MMPAVRIFLPTYRRPHLLPRAVASLLAQTFTDWICELHNDDPADSAPGELVARLGDPRIAYRRHERNLGGVATFNLFFRAQAEPFYTMLEDDNAWEPGFLASMLAVAHARPEATVFWCNQRLWAETDSGVRDLGTCVHSEDNTTPQRISWGQPGQFFGALHANGACLIRSRPGQDYTTPAVPFSLIEAFRERMFPHPMVYVPNALAHFTHTRTTARSDDRGAWAVAQTMLAATFLKHAGPAALATAWERAENQTPPATGTLLLAALIEPTCRPLWRRAPLAAKLKLLRGVARRPRVFGRVLRSRRRHADWWDFLDRHTAARFAESRRAV